MPFNATASTRSTAQQPSMLSTRKMNERAKPVVAPVFEKNASNGQPFLFNKVNGLVLAIGNDGFAPKNGRSHPFEQQLEFAQSCKSLIKHTTSHTQLPDPQEPLQE
ncbi:hypothetical protein GCM10007140_22100 [Priestia taiwanensis]|uniref:Uncharacterized protein n=1 Tax=Priestia taiwanensis TaxID=1347902 RepID=A0A917ERX0_9BACI|nr:hypothetical protein GCM10007140_22100 [Priestia taiwanensis]